MNNKGWGLSTMIALCGVIGFALIVSAILYQNTFKDDILPSSPNSNNNVVTESYKEMEAKLVEATIEYAKKYYPTPREDTVYVSVKQLQVEKLLEELTDHHNHVCTGYVSFESKDNNILYKPYLKCGSTYITDGYNKSFDK